MKTWVDKKWFERTLEIIPGASAWLFILSPIIFAYWAPTFIAIFILIYSFYWLMKSINISRHMIMGFFRLRRNMKINWLTLCQKAEKLKDLEKHQEQEYLKNKSLFGWEDLLVVQNLCGKQELVKDWKEIIHIALFAVSKEDQDILEPSILAVKNSNYPNDKIILLFAMEEAYQKQTEKMITTLAKKYSKDFYDIKWYWHIKKEDEVVGKGPNMTNAAKYFWEEYEGKIDPKDALVTTLDADHIVHKEYFAALSYYYSIDPNRDRKSYQPVALLFNNIWETPPMNRIAAISSSFWQIVEGMRPYRLRTFAAHTQSLSMLLITDFWSKTTIVEDGHQYWRSFFAMNGDHKMIPLMLPVYQDAVMGETLWEATKNAYKQKRRWAWGVSDFPYIVKNSIKHKEIPLHERLLQIFRHFAGSFSWSTASFFLALAWIPLAFNSAFQDTVIAHNISSFSSQMLRFAWFGIVINVWVSFVLAPPKPSSKYGLRYDLEMIFQWVLSAPYAIFLSALPALESQTRLMLGKKLEVFWITPKIRKHAPKVTEEKKSLT